MHKFRRLRVALFVPLVYGWLRLNLALSRVEYVYNIGWGYTASKPVRYEAAWRIQEHLKKLECFEECPECHWAARNWREEHGACDAIAWDRENYPEDYVALECGRCGEYVGQTDMECRNGHPHTEFIHSYTAIITRNPNKSYYW